MSVYISPQFNVMKGLIEQVKNPSNIYHCSNTHLSIQNTHNPNKDQVFSKSVESLYNQMEILLITLKENHFIDNEFYDFSTIYRISQLILNKKLHEINEEEIEIWSTMFNDFLNILELRIKLLPKNKEEYLKEYEIFEDKFFKEKDNFFTNYYFHDNSNEEIICELANILKD